MSFALFFCGPTLSELAALADGLVEELATSGVTAAVISSMGRAGVKQVPKESLGEHVTTLMQAGRAAIVLLEEASKDAREALLKACADPVVVDWKADSGSNFERSHRPHLTISSSTEPLDGLKQVFELLAGLAYLQGAEQGQLSTEQNAELVEKLKELGYV